MLKKRSSSHQGNAQHQLCDSSDPQQNVCLSELSLQKEETNTAPQRGVTYMKQGSALITQSSARHSKVGSASMKKHAWQVAFMSERSASLHAQRARLGSPSSRRLCSSCKSLHAPMLPCTWARTQAQHSPTPFSQTFAP